MEAPAASNRRHAFALPVVVAASLVLASVALQSQPRPQAVRAVGQGQTAQPPDFERMLRQQEETDQTWHAAGRGYMQMEKITQYRRGHAVGRHPSVAQTFSGGNQDS